VNKKLTLNETLDKIRQISGIKNDFYSEISEIFKNTPFNKELNFLKESTDILLKNQKEDFLSHLFESAEMLDALLDICVLSFSVENTKLGNDVITFSLPAGWTCPWANTCLKKVERYRVVDPNKVNTSKVSKRTGLDVPYKGDVVVHKGKNSQFDCFAANQEMQYDTVRENRWHNFDLLLAAGTYMDQADLIMKSLTFFFDNEGFRTDVRIHESGDFYSGEYLKAWMEVAKKMPENKFYAYTKSLPLVQKYQNELKDIPNLSITLSEGGRKDSELGNIDIKQAKVFNTPEDLLAAGLILDLDDNLAKEKGGKDKNFGLLIHGTQEAGEKQQLKLRNETFMAYWKYRKYLNRQLGLPTETRMSTEQADAALAHIDDILTNQEKYMKAKGIKRIDKTHFEYIKKLLRYVKKYNVYDFDDNLINILQDKYK